MTFITQSIVHTLLAIHALEISQGHLAEGFFSWDSYMYSFEEKCHNVGNLHSDKLARAVSLRAVFIQSTQN